MSHMPPILRHVQGTRFVLVVGLALLQAACLAATAFSVRSIFGTLHQTLPEQGKSSAIAAIFIAGIVFAAARVVERRIAEGMGQDYAASVRAKLFTALSKRSANELSAKRKGSISLRFVGDLTAIKGWVSQGLTRLISASLILLSGSVIVFWLNASLAVTIIVPAAIACFLIAILGTRLVEPEKRVRSRRARLAADMSERAPHAPELRMMGRLRRELSLLDRRAKSLRRAAVSRAHAGAMVKAVPDIALASMTGWVLWGALDNSLPAADAAAMLAAAGLIAAPIRDIATVADRRYSWLVAKDKCERVLSNDAGPSQVPIQIKRSLRCCVEIRDFSTGKVALFSSRLNAGELIALTGPCGSGKSQLLRCLAGLDKQAGGTVCVGKPAARSDGATPPLSSIVFIGPETPILAGTLRRALTMGMAVLPHDTEILEMARLYGLSSLLGRVDGLDHQLGEAGRDLSSGERASLLLARAALNRPTLLIVDEIDSGLGLGWRRLIDQLQTNTSTTVIVGLRDGTGTSSCDRHWTLENGHLVEMFPHKNTQDPKINGLMPQALGTQTLLRNC